MPSHVAPTLTATSKGALAASMVVQICIALIVAIYQIVFRTMPSWPAKRILVISFMKRLRGLSFEQRRFLFEPSGQAIATFSKSGKLATMPMPIDCGKAAPEATLYLIRCNTGVDEKVLLFLHGGGYVNSLSAPGHMTFALRCAGAAQAGSVAMLEYTLAPELRYPGQLVQAAAALNKLLETYEPGKIILGGDSAGGHLALALLSHLVKPHPQAPIIDLKGGQLGAAFLVSPWVKLRYDAPSYTVNASHDFLTREAMEEFTRLWKPTRGEVWADPMSGDTTVLQRLPVDAVLLAVGSWEVFLDDVLELSKVVNAEELGRGARIELVVSPEEVHDQPVMDCATNIEGNMLHSILSWLKSRAA